MMLDQSQTSTPEAMQRKERCPLEGVVAFYYTREGISYRCRRCHQIHLRPWEEILRHYRELVGSTI